MTEEEKQKLAEENKHINSNIIKIDIYDTLDEIENLRENAEALENIPLSNKNARIYHMRGRVLRDGIAKRMKFIEKLEAILEIRNRE